MMGDNYYQSPELHEEAGEFLIKPKLAKSLPWWVRLLLGVDVTACILLCIMGSAALIHLRDIEAHLLKALAVSNLLLGISGIITNYLLYKRQISSIKIAYFYFVLLGINYLFWYFHLEGMRVRALEREIENPALEGIAEGRLMRIIVILSTRLIFLAIYLTAFFKARTIILKAARTTNTDY